MFSAPWSCTGWVRGSRSIRGPRSALFPRARRAALSALWGARGRGQPLPSGPALRRDRLLEPNELLLSAPFGELRPIGPPALTLRGREEAMKALKPEATPKGRRTSWETLCAPLASLGGGRRKGLGGGWDACPPSLPPSACPSVSGRANPAWLVPGNVPVAGACVDGGAQGNCPRAKGQGVRPSHMPFVGGAAQAPETPTHGATGVSRAGARRLPRGRRAAVSEGPGCPARVC